MKKDLIELVFVLDDSGSMWSLTKDTISNYNKLLEERRKEGNCIVSTIVFNKYRKVIHDRISIDKVKNITTEDYVTGGSTALYDAVGATIDEIGKALNNTPEEERPEKVIFVIITDGEENASIEYSQKDVLEIITHQKEKYNWDFSFIGANIDAKKAANDIGISLNDAFAYSNNSTGTQSVYKSLDNAIHSYRETKTIDKTYLTNNII